MKVFGIFGASGAGKTTTAELVIRELNDRGYSVGSVKDIHATSFALDPPGTNTHRHRVAGSQMVIAWGLRETDILLQRRLALTELLPYFSQDFVLVEGGNQEPIPKILAAKSEQEAAERLDREVFALAGVLANTCVKYRGLPVLNARTRLKELVDLIVSKAREF